jgi:16S rRNA (cytosine967-C5)-methyltransferase
VNIRAVAAQLLSSFPRQYFNYEHKIAAMAKRLHLAQADQDFLYLIVKGVIQYRRLLDYIIQTVLDQALDKLEPEIVNILRAGAYQYLVLGTPLYAVTNESVIATKQLRKAAVAGLVNAVLRRLPDEAELNRQLAKLPANEALAIRTSHPQWLIDRWIGRHGLENTRQLAIFNNTYQQIYFRHNRLRIPWEQLEFQLKEAGFSPVIALADPVVFFTVDQPGRLLKSELWSAGYFSVQDNSQALAVRLLNPQPGEVVVDACAGPGGKTGFIAQLVGPSARIYAFDISATKIKLLQNEAFRLGIDFVNYGVADARKDRYPQADKILIDVPCSGTGVMARRADLRWNRKLEEIENLVEKQRQILEHMAAQLQPGGILVYSTCSLEEEENGGNVDWFLKNHPEFSIEPAAKFIEQGWCTPNGAVQVLPFVHRQTGSFAVRLINDNPGGRGARA